MNGSMLWKLVLKDVKVLFLRLRKVQAFQRKLILASKWQLLNFVKLLLIQHLVILFIQDSMFMIFVSPVELHHYAMTLVFQILSWIEKMYNKFLEFKEEIG